VTQGDAVREATGEATREAASEMIGEAVSGAAREAERLARTALAFDHDYDLDDTTRMYCTEIVWRVFDRAGVDVTEGSRSKVNMPGFRGLYILPTDIENNSRLELIYRF
jgi:hypothetical protein